MGLFSPPKIPDPVKPRDFTRGEREYYRGIVSEGDPLKEGRDRSAIDRLLTNSNEGILGPTPASTLALRNQSADQVNEQISQFMLESARLEGERQFQAEQQLGALRSERERDLDEYEQQVAQTDAMREVMKKNFQSGLLRAGVNLVGTIAGMPGVGNFLGGGQDQAPSYIPPDRKAKVGLGDPATFNFMSPEKDNQLFNNFDIGIPDDYDPLEELNTTGLYG